MNLSLMLLIKKARIMEVWMMTPFFIIGYVFTKPNVSINTIPNILLLVCHFYLLIQSIYLLNSFFGRNHDKTNKRFQGITINNKKTSFKYIASSLMLFLFSLIINYLNHWDGVLLISINYLLWILYGASSVNFKSNFFMGSLIHLISGIINFMLGYIAGSGAIIEGIAISIYFSLLFVSGHMHHMVIDYEADKYEELNTLSTVIGIEKTSKLSILFVIIASIYFVVLAVFKIVITVSVIPIIIACAVQILFFLQEENIDNYQARISYRKKYRIVHAMSMSILALIYLL